MASRIYHVSLVKDVRTLVDAFNAKEVMGAVVDNWANGTGEARGTATIEIRYSDSKERVVEGNMREVVKEMKWTIDKVEQG
jgi:hypothetical protein